MSRPVVLLIGCGVMAEPYLVAAQRLDYAIALVEVTARAQELQARLPDLIVDVVGVADEARDSDAAWIAPAFELAARVRGRDPGVSDQ